MSVLLTKSTVATKVAHTRLELNFLSLLLYSSLNTALLIGETDKCMHSSFFYIKFYIISINLRRLASAKNEKSVPFSYQVEFCTRRHFFTSSITHHFQHFSHG
jgi:hypothetical protein